MDESSPLHGDEASPIGEIDESSDEDVSHVSPPPRILAPDWKRSMQVRVRYYIPIVKWLPETTLKDVGKDFLAGITCAMLMLPAALSYSATIVKVPPMYGMYTCIFPALIYSVFGTSRQLSVGPEAVVSLLTGSAVSEFLASTSFAPSGDFNSTDFNVWEDSPEMQDRVATAAALALLVGLMTLLLGIFRVGFLDNVLSRPLLRGFITAVAAVIVVEQLGSMVFGKGYHWEYPIEPPETTSVTSSSTTLTGSTTATQSFLSTTSFPTTVSAAWFSAPLSTTSVSTQTTSTLTTSSSTETPEPSPQPEPKEHPPELTPLQKLISILHKVPGHAHVLTCIISLSSIAVLLLFRLVKAIGKRNAGWDWVENVPDILILMLVSIVISKFAHFELRGVRVLGKAAKGHGGLVPPAVPYVDIETTRLLMLPASLIAIIGFVESNACAKSIASKHDYALSPNRELVALGASNVFGSVFGCWPAFGSLARSTVVDRAGGQTQIMGLVAALVVLVVSIWLLPLLAPLPIPVLASIISVAASGLVETEDMAYFYKLGAWKELSMMLLSFLVTFILGIELGTLVSIVVSLIMVIRETTRIKVEVLGMVDQSDPMRSDQSEYLGPDGVRTTARRRSKFKPLAVRSSPANSPVRDDGAAPLPGLLILRIQESMLFFGNTGQLRERIRRLEVYGRKGVHPGEASPSEPTRAVILDWSSVNVMDASALQILDEIVENYHARGIMVCMVKVAPDLMPQFEAAGLHNDVMEAGGFFDRIRDAVEYYQANAVSAFSPTPSFPAEPLEQSASVAWWNTRDALDEVDERTGLLQA